MGVEEEGVSEGEFSCDVDDMQVMQNQFFEKEVGPEPEGKKREKKNCGVEVETAIASLIMWGNVMRQSDAVKIRRSASVCLYLFMKLLNGENNV